MFVNIKRRLVVMALTVMLAACGSNTDDLEEFVTAVKARPRGKIEPLPEYTAYESFIYDALMFRSPFDAPIREVVVERKIEISALKPDPTRPKQPLEAYDVDSLKMVGMLGNTPSIRALVRAPDAKIYQVSVGDYVGKNHGQVVAVTESQFDVVELVSAGVDVWTERPRSVRLVDNSGNN